MKKTLICILLSITLVFGFMPASTLRTRAATEVKINSTNFPDGYFREYISTMVDVDENGSLSVSERKAVTSLDLHGNEIESLKGIEYFTELVSLNCSNNSISKLSLSSNTKLQALNCSTNLLKTLDVSKLTALVALGCSANEITTLNVSQNTALQILYCDGNPLKSLDVSANTKLTELDCSGAKLTTLNVTQNKLLQYLFCSENAITSLNVRKNTKLLLLYCAENKFSTLDLSNNSSLVALDCSGLGLTTLDLSHNPDLGVLTCAENKLKNLDISEQAGLLSLVCSDNQLTTLDITNCPDLYILAIDGNQITTLNIGKNDRLIGPYHWSYEEEDGKTLYFDTRVKPTSYLLVDSGTKLIGRKPRVDVQPKNQAIPSGDQAAISLEASGGALSYQWYYRTSKDGEWQKVSAESGKTAVYTLTTKAKHDGYQYRCKVTNAQGSVYSKACTLTVVTRKPVIDAQPSDVVSKEGEKVSFTVKASGKAMSYQWYYKAPGSYSWQKVSAASGKKATYTLTVKAKHDGYQYRCVVTNPKGTVTSKECALYLPLEKPAIVRQPSDVITNDYSGEKTFSVEATGGGLSYQWYYRTSGTGSWKKVSEASGKTARYLIYPEADQDGYQYRCKVSNAYGYVWTKTRTLRVLTEEPVITKQPVSQTVKAGDQVTFHVEATGEYITYQWFFLAPGAMAWTPVSEESGKTADYTFTAGEQHNGWQYQCRAYNEVGTDYSSYATLTVVASAPKVTAQPKDMTVHEGEKAAFTVNATGEGLTYQWYYRTSGTDEWKPVSASSGKTASYSLTAKAKHNGYQYRCLVSNPAGEVYTKTVTLTVN